MDIRMPEMDGIKALKEMRSHETRTPVIPDDGLCGSGNRRRSATLRSLLTMLLNRLISMSAEFNRSARFTTPVNEKEIRHLHRTEHQLAMGAHSHQQPGDDGHLQRHRQNCPFSGQRLD